MQSTVKHWDALWEQQHDEPVHIRQLKHIAQLYEQLTDQSLKGRQVLEAGAGSAVDSIALKKRSGCEIVCVDYSAKSIEVIKANFKRNRISGKAVKADIRKLPFADGTFDVIFSNGVLEHFKDPLPIVKEQARVLKKNGLLVIGVPETYSLYTIKKHIQMRRGTWFAGWETEYSRGELRSLVERAKLKVIESKVYGNPPLWFPNWMKTLCLYSGLARVVASDVVVFCTKFQR